MRFPDPIQICDQRGYPESVPRRRLPVPGPVLVFLRVQVLLAAWAQRCVLAQLISGIDTPGEGIGWAASPARSWTGGAPPCCRYSCRMSGVLAKKFGRI